MPPKNPDDTIVAVFKNHAIKNEAKSAAEGRPVFDDMEVCEIRFPGSRNVSVFPATAVSHWTSDQYGGNQEQITYAERFAHQYQQFKAKLVQTKAGTPLAYMPSLTEARRAELRAQNIYTVEALAAIDGQPLKNLGYNGRELKNAALAFIEESKAQAGNTQAAAELEAVRAQLALLQEDHERLKQAQAAPKETPPDAQFDAMTIDQLREFITFNTGHEPHGSMSKKTLIRMAQECQNKAA